MSSTVPVRILKPHGVLESRILASSSTLQFSAALEHDADLTSRSPTLTNEQETHVPELKIVIRCVVSGQKVDVLLPLNRRH